jgi:hypothetical protein
LPCSQKNLGIPEGIPQPNFGDIFSHKILAQNSCATFVRRIRARICAQIRAHNYCTVFLRRHLAQNL